MSTYNVEIKEASRELTKREKIRFKDISNALKLDEAVTPDSPLIIQPKSYVILNVHNDKAEDKDYTNYLVEDTGGNKYVTGSESFWNSFISIWEEMVDDDDPEPWEIEVYKKDSKNYKGKQFLTCSIV